MFPANGSLLAAPPFPRTGPGESSSPTSWVILRRYDFPLTHTRSLIWFASGSHANPPHFVLALQRSRADGGSASGQGPCSAGVPLCPAHLRVDVCGSSQVSRRSILCLCPVPRPRPDRRTLTNTGCVDAAPANRRAKAPACYQYRGYRAALAPAVYASWGMLPLPMQDSLPAGWLAFAGRELNPLGRVERFPSCYISFPLPGFILSLW